MSAQNNEAAVLAANDAAPVAFYVAARDEADDWLGYESVHPLTWIPSPASAQTSVE